jgi:hypothetical protein
MVPFTAPSFIAEGLKLVDSKQLKTAKHLQRAFEANWTVVSVKFVGGRLDENKLRQWFD